MAYFAAMKRAPFTILRKKVVEPHFVVKVVEMSVMQVVAVFAGIIYFGNENQVWVLLFDLRYGPTPEFHRHHLGHVASESIDVFSGPKE